MRSIRRALAIAAASAGLITVAGQAQAAPPPAATTLYDLSGTSTAGADGYCAFPVQIDYVSSQRDKKTTLPDGTTIERFRGHAFAVVTNRQTGKSVRYTVSGPGTLTTRPDGSFTIDAAGPNLLWTTVGNSYPGVPQLVYTTGHVHVAVAASGRTTSYSLRGHSTDVCSALR